MKNGGGLGTLTGSSGSSLTINPGATFALNDVSITADNLAGSGAINLGKIFHHRFLRRAPPSLLPDSTV